MPESYTWLLEASASEKVRVLDVGIVSPERATSRLAPPIDDATSTNSLDEVSRRDAAGAVRCDDGSAGAVRCDDECAHRAPSRAIDIVDPHISSSVLY